MHRLNCFDVHLIFKHEISEVHVIFVLGNRSAFMGELNSYLGDVEGEWHQPVHTTLLTLSLQLARSAVRDRRYEAQNLKLGPVVHLEQEFERSFLVQHRLVVLVVMVQTLQQRSINTESIACI